MPITNVQLGQNVEISLPDLVNLYGCTIGDETKVGPFVEIQKNATIGSLCKISSHSFICGGAAQQRARLRRRRVVHHVSNRRPDMA